MSLIYRFSKLLIFGCGVEQRRFGCEWTWILLQATMVLRLLLRDVLNGLQLVDQAYIGVSWLAHRFMILDRVMVDGSRDCVM